jgi:hypothetical protein
MKQFLRVLTAVFFATAVMAAYAHQKECNEPNGPKKEKGKPSKVTILHCGCSDAGDFMEYKQIQVSSKSRGHLRHISGTHASCSDGTDTYQDFVRNGSDCQIDDGAPELEGMDFCNPDSTAKQPGETCGSLDTDTSG